MRSEKPDKAPGSLDGSTRPGRKLTIPGGPVGHDRLLERIADRHPVLARSLARRPSEGRNDDERR